MLGTSANLPGGTARRKMGGAGTEDFHSLKDIEVPLPEDLKLLRDLLENSFAPHRIVGIRLRIRIVPSEKFCFYLQYIS